MRCTSPRTVGFYADGKTLCWSQSKASKEFSTFQLPCGKCTECRLEYARQWAVRCVHESQVHEKNSFITLTYAPEKLVSPKLIYSDFQKFMKKLRKTQDTPIGVFVTGEYGDKTKRPHWHAILFNYEPPDLKFKRSNDRGDRIYSSQVLDKIWANGTTEIGSVTFESAGYCARYAAKKLSHGKDSEHDFQPISKKSSKHAIGKKWLEKNWPDIFNYGKCELLGKPDSSIPRYYEKWLKINQPEAWVTYVTRTKQKIIHDARSRSEQQLKEWQDMVDNRHYTRRWNVLTPNQVRKIIQEQKFKILQNHLKL